MDKPRIAKIETNVEAVLASYEKCEAGNCDGCAFEYMRRDWPAACAFYQQHSARYLLKKLAEQMPRVMTLEEAINGPKVGYLEFRYHLERGWVKCDFDSHLKDKEVILLFSADVTFYQPEKSYGRLWRLWISRPTDEQMKATPWAEPPKEG